MIIEINFVLIFVPNLSCIESETCATQKLQISYNTMHC